MFTRIVHDPCKHVILDEKWAASTGLSVASVLGQYWHSITLLWECRPLQVLHEQELLADMHIDGLMQERRNSMANALELVFLALTHRYVPVKWWCHDLEMFSMLLAHCEGNPLVTGRFPSQRASNADFDVFFHVSLKKWLNKQSSCQWLSHHDTHVDVTIMELVRLKIMALNIFITTPLS